MVILSWICCFWTLRGRGLGLDHLSDYLSLGQSLTAMDDGREMDVNANIKSATIAK